MATKLAPESSPEKWRFGAEKVPFKSDRPDQTQNT
jgi:hypothetical protein